MKRTALLSALLLAACEPVDREAVCAAAREERAAVEVCAKSDDDCAGRLRIANTNQAVYCDVRTAQ